VQVLAVEFNPQISLYPGGQGPAFNSVCHWTAKVYLPNGM